MNIENVKKAIAIMERAGKVAMTEWQSGEFPVDTEQELHACGNSACFAGWIAVSPEFQADGGKVGDLGEPILGIFIRGLAVASWLDIGHDKADLLINGYLDLEEEYSRFYQKPWAEVNAQDVIIKLEELLQQEGT